VASRGNSATVPHWSTGEQGLGRLGLAIYWVGLVALGDAAWVASVITAVVMSEHAMG
jgi:hypothetical protein